MIYLFEFSLPLPMHSRRIIRYRMHVNPILFESDGGVRTDATGTDESASPRCFFFILVASGSER